MPPHLAARGADSTAGQGQTAVTAHFSSKQLLLFVFAWKWKSSSLVKTSTIVDTIQVLMAAINRSYQPLTEVINMS